MQPEAVQSCQWQAASYFQAGSQTWVWPGVLAAGVQTALSVTSPAGILKRTSGELRPARVIPSASQAEKVKPSFLPARTVTSAPS